MLEYECLKRIKCALLGLPCRNELCQKINGVKLLFKGLNW